VACETSAPARRPSVVSSARSSPSAWIATIAPGIGFAPEREPTTRSVPPAIGRAPEASASSASSSEPAAT
jgi:hypothetical protein